jgi:hypothetical protein
MNGLITFNFNLDRQKKVCLLFHFTKYFQGKHQTRSNFFAVPGNIATKRFFSKILPTLLYRKVSCLLLIKISWLKTDFTEVCGGWIQKQVYELHAAIKLVKHTVLCCSSQISRIQSVSRIKEVDFEPWFDMMAVCVIQSNN